MYDRLQQQPPFNESPASALHCTTALVLFLVDLVPHFLRQRTERLHLMQLRLPRDDRVVAVVAVAVGQRLGHGVQLLVLVPSHAEAVWTAEARVLARDAQAAAEHALQLGH